MQIARAWLVPLALVSAQFASTPAFAQAGSTSYDVRAALGQCGLTLESIGPAYLYVQQYYLQERFGPNSPVVGKWIDFHPQAGTKVGDGMLCVQRIAKADAAKDGPTGRMLPAQDNSAEVAKVKQQVDLCDNQSIEPGTVIAACTFLLNSPLFNQQYRANAFLARGIGYARASDVPHAMADYDAGIALNPNLPTLWADRGGLHFSQGDVQGAISDLTRASQLAPNEADIWARLAAAQDAAKQYAPAAASYEKAAAINPRDAGSLNSACWMRAMGRLGLTQALADCNASIAINAEANTFDSRGLVKLLMGDNQGAFEDYSMAVIKDASQTGSLYGRGVARMRLGQTVLGQADIATALQKDPSLSSKYIERGVPMPTAVAVAPPRPAPAPPAPAPRVTPPTQAAGGGTDYFNVENLLPCFKLMTRPRLISPDKTKPEPDYLFDVTNGCTVAGWYGYHGVVPGVRNPMVDGGKMLRPGEVDHIRVGALDTRKGLMVGITYACPTKEALQPRYRRKVVWAGPDSPKGSKDLFYCKGQFEPAPVGAAR